MNFRRGFYTSGDDEMAIEEFSLYGDGLVAEATMTVFAEVFLYDFLKWGLTELNFSALSGSPRVQYVSNLIIEFDNDILSSIELLSKIGETISSAISPSLSAKEKFIPARIAFSQDRPGTSSKISSPQTSYWNAGQTSSSNATDFTPGATTSL